LNSFTPEIFDCFTCIVRKLPGVFFERCGFPLVLLVDACFEVVGLDLLLGRFDLLEERA